MITKPPPDTANVTVQGDVTIDLAAIRAMCAQADEARANLDTDFPVGATARFKWQEARRAMADATPALLAHIEDLTRRLTGQADVVELLKRLEWAGVYYPGGRACPVCGNVRASGHQNTCSLHRVISQANVSKQAGAE